MNLHAPGINSSVQRPRVFCAGLARGFAEFGQSGPLSQGVHVAIWYISGPQSSYMEPLQVLCIY